MYVCMYVCMYVTYGMDECILLIIYVCIVLCVSMHICIFACIVSNIYNVVRRIPEVCSTSTNDETVDSGYRGVIKKTFQMNYNTGHVYLIYI